LRLAAGVDLSLLLEQARIGHAPTLGPVG